MTKYVIYWEWQLKNVWIIDSNEAHTLADFSLEKGKWLQGSFFDVLKTLNAIEIMEFWE